MKDLRCVNCNAPLEIENQFARTLTCKYCGSSYLLPGEAPDQPAHPPQQTGTEPLQSVITGLAPLPPGCVLRESADEADRTLTITGEYFPTIHHGLQFSRADDNRLSLIFDMEVNWESPTRITVDMARIKHALWRDTRLLLRARLMNTENSNYQPHSDWSTEFILVDRI